MELRGPERYNYKQPRRFNVVTFLLVILLLALGYGGWKFGPVFWQWYQAGGVLDEIKTQATPLHRKNGLSDDSQREVIEKTVANGIARLHQLGIEDYPDQPLQVWISPDHNYLQAKYKVVVHHLFTSKTTSLTFLRDVKIPAEGTGF